MLASRRSPPGAKSSNSSSSSSSSSSSYKKKCRNVIAKTRLQRLLEDSTSSAASNYTAAGDTVSCSQSTTATQSITAATNSTDSILNIKRPSNDNIASSVNSERTVTPEAITELLRQQREISEFFKEATLRMTNVLNNETNDTYQDDGDDYPEEEEDASLNNGAFVRSPKATNVRTVVELMAEQHERLAQRVATIALESLEQVEEKKRELEKNEQYVQRLNRYIHSIKRRYKHNKSKKDESPSSSHPSTPRTSSGVKSSAPTHRRKDLPSPARLDDDFAVDSCEVPIGVPTEIEMPQTYIDLFEYLESPQEEGDGEEDGDEGEATTVATPLKEATITDEMIEKISPASGNNASIRFLL